MRIGAFGEVMLRLSPLEYRLLEQSHTLRMDYTGTGVNILANLAHFDVETTMLTSVPDNRLGDAAQASLRSYGINTNYVRKYHNHIGSYFAEIGFGNRPTYVTYQNRLESSFGISGPDVYPIDSFLDSVDVIHICGISLSLTNETWLTALKIAKRADEKQKKVCFDFNFRPSLNKEKEKADLLKQRYEEILPHCHIVFGSIRDLTDLLQLAEQPKNEEEKVAIIRKFLNKYDVEWFCGTQRIMEEEKPMIRGEVYTTKDVFKTQLKPLTVLDRIGAGDAYAAGILLGYIEQWTMKYTIEFAITNAVLAHTIPGDVPLTTKEQVLQTLKDPKTDLLR